VAAQLLVVAISPIEVGFFSLERGEGSLEVDLLSCSKLKEKGLYQLSKQVHLSIQACETNSNYHVDL
jgi:hypothetical protein